jgi:hypothetical protein
MDLLQFALGYFLQALAQAAIAVGGTIIIAVILGVAGDIRASIRRRKP